MTDRNSQLLNILGIGHDTSIGGEGISLREALARTRYKEPRPTFSPHDLVPLIKAHRGLTEQWIAYSEDKRTDGGWYLLEHGEIGQLGHSDSMKRFSSLEEAVADYVVRELDFWAGLQDGRQK